MPGFDGTGPWGMGPLTGRGFGLCGYGWYRGFRRGRGLDRYFCGWGLPQTREDQLKALGEYRKVLEEELKDIGQEEQELKKQV